MGYSTLDAERNSNNRGRGHSWLCLNPFYEFCFGAFAFGGFGEFVCELRAVMLRPEMKVPRRGKEPVTYWSHKI